MRILHVNKFFDFHGGAEVYLHQLVEKQRLQGHDVHIFSTQKASTSLGEDAKFSPAYHAYDRSEGFVEDAKKGLAFLWNREAKRQFSAMLDAVKPDIVHVHNIYHHLSSSILGEIRERKIPCVQTLHDHKLACPNYKMYTQGANCDRCKNGNYFQAVKFQCLSTSTLANILGATEMHLTKATAAYEKTVQAFLCPSRYMQKTMIAWGEPGSKMVYLPNPTDLPQEMATGGGGYVLYTGRLSEEKGVDTLIRGIVRVPELALWIAGSGPEEARLKALAEELGAAHVRFLGFVPPEELAKMRIKAEAIVLATKMRENASGALLEGLAAGLPCLATNVGGNPELIEEGKTGWLLPPNDPIAWHEGFLRLKQTSLVRRREMGLRGRAFIERERTWKKHLDAMEEVYEMVRA